MRAQRGSKERQRLFALGSLSAILHSDPLGQVADLLGLTAASLGAPPQPHFSAASQLILEMLERLGEGNQGLEADALALARLAQASPTQLRALARELYEARTP